MSYELKELGSDLSSRGASACTITFDTNFDKFITQTDSTLRDAQEMISMASNLLGKCVEDSKIPGMSEGQVVGDKLSPSVLSDFKEVTKTSVQGGNKDLKGYISSFLTDGTYDPKLKAGLKAVLPRVFQKLNQTTCKVFTNYLSTLNKLSSCPTNSLEKYYLKYTRDGILADLVLLNDQAAMARAFLELYNNSLSPRSREILEAGANVTNGNGILSKARAALGSKITSLGDLRSAVTRSGFLGKCNSPPNEEFFVTANQLVKEMKKQLNDNDFLCLPRKPRPVHDDIDADIREYLHGKELGMDDMVSKIEAAIKDKVVDGKEVDGFSDFYSALQKNAAEYLCKLGNDYLKFIDDVDMACVKGGNHSDLEARRLELYLSAANGEVRLKTLERMKDALNEAENVRNSYEKLIATFKALE